MPTLTLGVDTTNDPANAMFNTDELPGRRRRRPDQRARALRAADRPRHARSPATRASTARPGKYVYLGMGRTDEQQDEIGLFVQDSWRIQPNLTLNAGLRWQIAFPFQANESVYSMNTMADSLRRLRARRRPGRPRLQSVQSGRLQRRRPHAGLRALHGRHPGYNTEYDNFAPNVGVAWQPNVQRRLAAQDSRRSRRRRRSARATACRTTATASGFFQGVYNGNPGNQITTNRTSTSTQFPLVPRRRDLAGAAARAGPARPVAGHSGVARLSDGDRLQQRRQPVPSELQDAVLAVVLGRPAAADRHEDGHRSPLRRHATRRRHDHRGLERGELDDERLPRRVQARAGEPAGQHGAAGARRTRSPTSGRAPGTSPLPIYLANFNGSRRRTPAITALYTGTNWTNTARLTELAARNPNPGGAPRTRCGRTAAFRTNMVAAGYPSNFFVLNPAVSSASSHDQRQHDEVRLAADHASAGRCRTGWRVDANYVFAHAVRVDARHAAADRARSCGPRPACRTR